MSESSSKGADPLSIHGIGQGFDVEAFGRNMALYMEAAQKANAALLRPYQERHKTPGVNDEMAEMMKSVSAVAERWMTDPQKAFEAQIQLGQQYVELWSAAWRRLSGEAIEQASTASKDKRFVDPEWSSNPGFDFLKQAYLVSSSWADRMVQEAEGLDEHTRAKAAFYVRQLTSAMSPSNFVATNPELLRETLRENGANLARGMAMLAEDIEAGGGDIKIRQSDYSKFKVGENIAITPGKVVFRNDLIELLQYTPTTETVLKRPLLIVPPWINKFYVLDLNPQKSFIAWCVAQGLTVFCISWVNPDARQAEKGFESYMNEGILAALEAIEAATGEKRSTAIGYCVGGTMLGVTLAYMAAKRDKRIDSATFFTTQVDFTHAGELKIFVDEGQVEAVEAVMKTRGYLEGSRMANAFNMLRPNDLIWPYVVNVYLKGQSPFPFDLLYWNSDATRMPAANHSYYLRNCYLENKLAKGEMVLDNTKLDLGKVKIPVFNLATREDHIAPAKSVHLGSKKFGGPVDYVVAGSGHIAGVVNPPTKPKYGFRTGSLDPDESFEDWLGKAKEHEGSWWPYWFSWIEKQAPDRVPAREPGAGGLPALGDAPGEYVLVKS